MPTRRVLTTILEREKDRSFDDVSASLERLIFSFDKDDVLDVLLRVGMIPEQIGRDSTDEKLFSKASDLVLARSLELLGFDVDVPKRRGDSADVVARSRFFDYLLVADAKSFRLSRTAKNQKDYKVVALRSWRENSSADYAVLVAPLFQYPTNESQIFKQALETNVCLFSWEHLYFWLSSNLEETRTRRLEPLWRISEELSKSVPCAESKRSFLNVANERLRAEFNLTRNAWRAAVDASRKAIVEQGAEEIANVEREIERVRSLSRAEAIERLIKELKLEANATTIKNYLRRVTDANQ